jgi:hypothetical protein
VVAVSLVPRLLLSLFSTVISAILTLTQITQTHPGPTPGFVDERDSLTWK